ncbi:hypothetical protein SAMN02799630_05407 [Paenibacillus sp. UNCCL117]|nr:hypothetical protein SAMN04488602_12959 [Paenibacillus sp. cl123]SFW65692.1 hypothetical protein SAMN02799630_05407 [Paenibacillus sp. UNCCL117]
MEIPGIVLPKNRKSHTHLFNVFSQKKRIKAPGWQLKIGELCEKTYKGTRLAVKNRGAVRKIQ